MNPIKNPDLKRSDLVISEKHPYFFVWHKELKIVTELWSSENPKEFWMCQFETFAYSGLVNSWAPYAGAQNKVLTLRKIWLCGNSFSDVEKMLNYVENGYSPLGEITIEQFPNRFEQVLHIQVIT
jgi:hypothetical protein